MFDMSLDTHGGKHQLDWIVEAYNHVCNFIILLLSFLIFQKTGVSKFIWGVEISWFIAYMRQSQLMVMEVSQQAIKMETQSLHM